MFSWRDNLYWYFFETKEQNVYCVSIKNKNGENGNNRYTY